MKVTQLNEYLVELNDDVAPEYDTERPTMLPHPLFGSRTSFSEHGKSGFPPEEKIVLQFLGRIDEHLCSLATYQYGVEFLKTKVDSELTYILYRTSIERLMLWALLIKKKNLLQLDVNDAQEFMAFLQDPPLGWAGGAAVTRFIIRPDSASGEAAAQVNPEWRPFDYLGLPKSQHTIHSINKCCLAFFNYLNAQGITNNTPFRAISSGVEVRSMSTLPSTPGLTTSHWMEAVRVAEKMASANPKKYERTLFLTALFGYIEIKPYELFENGTKLICISSFYHENLDWELRLSSTLGVRQISVPRIFAQSYLLRYCSYLGLPFPPRVNSYIPIIHRLREGRGLELRVVKRAMREVFKSVIAEMQARQLATDVVHSYKLAVKKWFNDGEKPREEGIEHLYQNIPMHPQPLFSDYKLKDYVNFGAFEDIHWQVVEFLFNLDGQLNPFKCYSLINNFLCGIDNKTSYESYRKYAERFLLWALLVKRKSILLLEKVDVVEFLDFCLTPPADWVCTGLTKRFVKINEAETVMSPKWRPFRTTSRSGFKCGLALYISSKHTLAGQYTICSLIYEYCVELKVIVANPLADPSAFANYAHTKSDERSFREQGIADIYNTFVQGCQSMAEVDESYSRVHFFVCTINALRLSIVDLRRFGPHLRFSSFRQSHPGSYSVILKAVDGRSIERPLPLHYIDSVLLPYRAKLKREHVPLEKDETAIFAALRHNDTCLSASRIARLIRPIARALADDLAAKGGDPDHLRRLRVLTINAIANADS